jgi:hypothetical protein
VKLLASLASTNMFEMSAAEPTPCLAHTFWIPRGTLVIHGGWNELGGGIALAGTVGGRMSVAALANASEGRCWCLSWNCWGHRRFPHSDGLKPVKVAIAEMLAMDAKRATKSWPFLSRDTCPVARPSCTNECQIKRGKLSGCPSVDGGDHNGHVFDVVAGHEKVVVGPSPWRVGHLHDQMAAIVASSQRALDSAPILLPIQRNVRLQSRLQSRQVRDAIRVHKL